MSNVEIANVILQQLGGGGGRISAMTGAKTFVAIEKGVMFTFPQRAGKPNHVRIELNGRDEYAVSFWKIRGSKATLIEELTGLYAEDLKRTFEKQTGLYLSL